MDGRRPYDLFEPWPDDDDEVPVAEARTVAFMVALVAVVIVALVAGLVVALIALGHYFDDRANHPPPSEGLRCPSAQECGSIVA